MPAPIKKTPPAVPKSGVEKTNFIGQRIDAELAVAGTDIVTRFPPEPNGYLHIGHAKSICLNFGIAAHYRGQCALRFDDTNPARESAEFVDAIIEDIRWLGFECSRLTYASDYFAQLHAYAIELIEQGLAYVDDQSAEQIRASRGTLTTPGTDSPHRARSVAENLALFAAMKNGQFADGEKALRANIDMASPNLNLRDPVLYRIRHCHHQRTKNQWCIYPMYDFTHGQSDAIEGVTHSLCTLEFEDHRALYDWFLDHLSTPSRPRQIEFSRLNLNYTVMSKRLLAQLVDGGDVDGWDDPRMPTLRGLRRRGYTAAAIRRFIDLIGVTRKVNIIDMGLLENCAREDLDAVAPRAMAVLDPLKVVIENYPEGESEVIQARNHPGDADMGTRPLTLSRHLYIERDDFMEEPPKKFHRLSPGQEVRLRYGFVVRCTEVRRDAAGQPVELRCQYDAATRHGAQPEGRRVRGIIHWVNAADAVAAQVRLYDRLFSVANPLQDKNEDFRAALNARSLVRKNALLEASLGDAAPQTRYQFERLGYFMLDAGSQAGTPQADKSQSGKLVFNRIVTLRDSWAKIDHQRATAPSSA